MKVCGPRHKQLYYLIFNILACQQSALYVLIDVLQEFFKKVCQHLNTATKEAQDASEFPVITFISSAVFFFHYWVLEYNRESAN